MLKAGCSLLSRATNLPGFKVMCQKLFIRTALFLSALLLCFCSNPNLSTTSGRNTALKIEKDFLIIRNSAAQSYLLELQKRLFGSNTAYLSVKLARDSQAFASSFEGNLIILSSGLIAGCSNEAELAFVLAHEYAHLDLGHQLDRKSDLSEEELKARELAADIMALQIVFEAGFSIEAAKSSIAKFTDQFAKSSGVLAGEQSKAYPSATERLANLQSAFLTELCSKSLGCFSTGTLDSRAFRNFKRELGS